MAATRCKGRVRFDPAFFVPCCAACLGNASERLRKLIEAQPRADLQEPDASPFQAHPLICSHHIPARPLPAMRPGRVRLIGRSCHRNDMISHRAACSRCGSRRRSSDRKCAPRKMIAIATHPPGLRLHAGDRCRPHGGRFGHGFRCDAPRVWHYLLSHPACRPGPPDCAADKRAVCSAAAGRKTPRPAGPGRWSVDLAQLSWRGSHGRSRRVAGSRA